MNFDSILNGIRSLFGRKDQQQEVVSPVPAGDVMTQGLAQKMKFDDIMEKQTALKNAAMAGQPTPTPYSVTDAATAIMNKRADALKKVRTYVPEFKGSDDDFNRYYDKYGDELLQTANERMPRKTLGASTTDFDSIIARQSPKRGGKLAPTPTLLPNAPENPYMEIIKKYFPEGEWNNASNVMFKESSFLPDTVAVNEGKDGKDATRDYGLFQINDYWQRENLKKMGLRIEDMLDPETAIKYASWLYSQQGWNPWMGAKPLGLHR